MREARRLLAEPGRSQGSVRPVLLSWQVDVLIDILKHRLVSVASRLTRAQKYAVSLSALNV